MIGPFSLRRLKDISITKKLYFVVGTMAVLIAVELITLWFSIQTLSSVRALVGAEGLYSKAQKDGIYQLLKYSHTHNEDDYASFLKFMSVPLGDHKTRLELMKEHPDLNISRQGFIEGRIHPEDIDGMLNLLQRFHKNYYIKRAIQIWTEGDSLISILVPIGEKIHHEIISNNSDIELNKLIAQIDLLNERLTLLEDNFSYTLGEGSRWLENLILKILFIVALTVEITGLIMSISVSRGISRGLNEINRASRKIAKGDLTERAAILSKDEIGQVAIAMNQMTEQLISSNKELGQFAYIASHDLQEPLRTISNYVGLFNKKYKNNLDSEADKYIEFITSATGRMQLQIKDLLDYSRIGYDKVMSKIDCNLLIKEVLDDLNSAIRDNNVKFYYDKLPVITGYKEIKSLFLNLTSNAIKFRKENTTLIINVSSKENSNEWVFSVKDNGIGIEPKYFDRIFTIFQKLHSPKEYAGSGIGLAHCKKIVEMHGGKIWVESETGKGSIFYFSIPKNTSV